MRKQHRLYLMSGILAGAVALGCQAPQPTAPVTPRTALRVGAITLDPSTDLAVEFNKECGSAQAGYGLKQADPAIDPRIVKFTLKITGTSMIGAIEDEVTVAAFQGGCQLTKEIGDLPPGTYTVLMNGVDASGRPISSGTKSLELVAGGPPLVIPVKCDFTTGKLSVLIDCCSPAPTTAPSGGASPTPTPAPTVTPTPTATPTPPPADPTALMTLIHGLHADVQGNVYLFGNHRSVPAGIATQPRGTIVKVAPDATMTELFAQPGPTFFEGDIDADGKLQAFSDLYAFNTAVKYNHRLTVDLQTGAYSYTNFQFQRPTLFVPPWGASTLDQNGKLIIAPGYYYSQLVPRWEAVREPGAFSDTDPNMVAVGNVGTGGASTLAISRPVSMIWDPDDGPVAGGTVLGRPIWSSGVGIFESNAMPPAFTASWTTLIAGQTYGLAKVDESATGLLYTKYMQGDSKVYYTYLDGDKDSDPNTSATPVEEIAFTFAANSRPLRIEKRARAVPDDGDNTFYVLLVEDPITPALWFPGKQQIRVVKLTYDPINRKLTNPALVVDSFSNPAPSW